MQCDLHIAGGFFEPGKLSGVQGAVWIQDADHNSVRAFLPEDGDLFIEFIALVAAEAVIAVPWAQQCPDLQVRIFPDLAEQRHRRGHAADDQVAAELHPVRASFLGGNGGFHTVYTGFKDIVFHGFHLVCPDAVHPHPYRN